MSINSKQLLPLAMNTEVWRDFFDAWDEELRLFKDQIDIKKSLLDSERIDSADELIRILRDFGYNPNRVLDDSLDFLRTEIKTLLFKVRNKTTYQIYEYFFNIIGVKSRIFNYFFDGVKLVESVDMTKTTNNLALFFDKSKFFYGIEPILNLNLFLNKQLTLDEPEEEYNLDLDKDTIWHLDDDIVVYSTRHISIDFYPDHLFDVEGEDYLYLKEYSIFYNDIAQYNRKCVEVPHIGLLLSFVMNNSGIYNYYSNNQYSVPDLKINCATTITTASFTPALLVSLDEEDPDAVGEYTMDLDRSIVWRLDQDVQEQEEDNIFERFAYICAGIGTKNMVNAEFYPALMDNTILLALWDFDNYTAESDSIFKDYSVNNRPFEVVNTNFTIQKYGIISRSLLLQGIDSYGYVEDLITDRETLTLTFWVNIDSSQVSNETHIIHLSSVKISYIEDTKLLRVTITDGVNTVIGDTDFTGYEGTNCMISIAIDNETNDTAKVYINGVLQNTIDISTILTILSSSPVYFGTDIDKITFYKGLLDSIRFYKTELQAEPIAYLHDNRIGNNASSLDDEILCEPISKGELYDRDSFYYINTLVKCNHVKNQRIFRAGISEEENYIGYIDQVLPIKRRTFELIYETEDGVKKAVDDGGGNLNSYSGVSNIEGTIDYETGEYNINFFRIISVVNEDGGTTTIFDGSLVGKNLLINTVIVNYSIGDNDYSITDNGRGAFEPTEGFLGGTINYVSGAIYLEFEFEATMNFNYQYKNELLPSPNTIVNMNYKIDNIIPITEVGIKNIKGDIVTYCSFPKVEMLHNDHISTGFIIYKE